MKDFHIDTIKMVREIRDKQSELYWKNPEEYKKRLKAASEKLKAKSKKRKRAHVA